ncbi:glycosyltransferase [uncultured Williamsia sp.]|uniref:glycosyltransferase n=1 Tax=uncultured Williamsia sp. TaxID=259311 RepID=UPI00261A17D4|nr:glycosyltransferase [uncultured Williamsia sp.]
MTTRPLVVILASTPFDGHQLYDQRLARALATNYDVVYVDPPRAFGRPRPGGRGVAERGGTAVVSPRMLPFGKRRPLFALTGFLVGVGVRWEMRKRTKNRRQVRYVVIAASAMTLRALPRARSVHLVKDNYIAGADLIGIDAALVSRRFTARMAQADAVCVVSPHLREILVRRGIRSSVVPAGCSPDETTHPEPADLVRVENPRAVFIGMVSDRIDLALMAALLEAGISVVVVGPVQNTFTKHAELADLLLRPAFHHLNSRTGTELHAVLQHCDVGLIPYVRSEFNDSSFPLKAFEYLAAGLQIVSTPLPAMAWLGHDVIHIEGETEAFVRATIAACRSRGTRAEECKAIAADNSWGNRAAVFADLLGLTG